MYGPWLCSRWKSPKPCSIRDRFVVGQATFIKEAQSPRKFALRTAWRGRAMERRSVTPLTQRSDTRRFRSAKPQSSRSPKSSGSRGCGPGVIQAMSGSSPSGVLPVFVERSSRRCPRFSALSLLRSARLVSRARLVIDGRDLKRPSLSHQRSLRSPRRLFPLLDRGEPPPPPPSKPPPPPPPP